MIDKNNIKKMLTGILRHKAGLSDHKIMHPAREWLIGLTLTLILLSTSAFGSLYIYRQFNADPSHDDSEEATVPAVVYREPEIKQAILNIEERQNEYNSLKASMLKNQPTEPLITPQEVAEPNPNPQVGTSSESVAEPIIIPREPEAGNVAPTEETAAEPATETPPEPGAMVENYGSPALGN